MTPGDVRIPEEVMAAELEGEAVLLHMETKRYYRLNETGACIWGGLREGLDRDALVDRLVERFRVGADEAAGELESFLRRLAEHDLVEAAG